MSVLFRVLQIGGAQTLNLLLQALQTFLISDGLRAPVLVLRVSIHQLNVTSLQLFVAFEHLI